MPCDDITEVITLCLDAQERLRDYAVTKRTCGAPIGATALLLPVLAGSTADAICAQTAATVMQRFSSIPQDEEFLYVKHLVALQSALRVLFGHDPGTPQSPCITVSVARDAAGLHFEGLIVAERLAAKIKACGHCGSCGAHSDHAPARS